MKKRVIFSLRFLREYLLTLFCQIYLNLNQKSSLALPFIIHEEKKGR